MKKKIILITLICSLFIISSLIGIFFIKNVKGISDLDYIFNKDILYNTNDISDKYNYNIRNQTTITQDNYTATYDFLNENNGILIPNEWINSSTEGYIEIVNEYQSHNKVVELHDVNDGQVGFYQFLSDIDYGTIEYWFLSTDMSNGRPMIWLFHGANELFRIYVRDNFVKAYNGDFQECGYVAENIWIHIRIDFECTIGGYNGLSQYKFKVYTNNIPYGSFSFINNEIHIDKIEIIGTSAVGSYYIDAIGYSWDINYTISQNIAFPKTTITTTIKEVDKFEFDFETFHSLYAIGSDNPSGWIDIENGYDHTNINSIESDRCIKIEGLKSTHEITGLEKDFDSNDMIFNITWSIEFTEINNEGSIFETKIFDNTSNEITRFGIQWSGVGSIYDFSYSSQYLTLIESILPNLEYEFNYYINLYYGISILMYYKEGIYQDFFIIPMENNNLEGLSIVRFRIWNTADDGTANMITNLRYIGVYNSTHSLTSELGYIQNIEIYYPLNLIWYFEKTNLFSSNIIGNYSICINEQTESLLTKYVDIVSLDYRNESVLTNIYNIVYDSSYHLLLEPVIYIEFYNQIELREINIEGVKLTGTYDIYPSYSFNNINISQNYFYVSNHRLYFTHNASQDDFLEYIQADFNIPDIYAINRSINFKTYFLGISKAYLINNYVSDTNTTFNFRLGYETINYILPQQEILKTLTILMTDNNNSDYYGNSEGYISSITLRYYPDIAITITTIELIDVIIPLILIIIPTLAIYYHYGKNSIIPMILLMSILSFVSNLIPIWLLFLIIYSSLVYLILQQKSGDI